MIKFYECYTTAADELNQKDFCLEVWGENSPYPVRMFYFSDYEGDSIYHWLMWCADEVVSTNITNEIRIVITVITQTQINVATENFFLFLVI